MNNQGIIFCDFNGVISHNNFWQTLENPNHPLHIYHEKIVTYFLEKSNSLCSKWMLGEFTTEQVHKILSEKTGVPYQELLDIFIDETSTIDLSFKILQALKRLKPHYIVILSTGNMDSLDRFTIPNNPILNDVYDLIDNSYNLKTQKTTDDGKYFLKRADDLNVNIKNCHVLDDSKKVCDIFTKLGGNSFLVNNEQEVIKYLVKL
jgi:hypothetical protein